MVIRRYVRQELAQMTAVTLLVLLLVFISHVFVRYLGEVAAGKYPIIFMIEILLLEVPHLLGILCPLSFYLSLMLVLGRLYADSEMVVLCASGMSQGQLFRILLNSVCLVSLIAGWLSLYLVPHVLALRADLRAEARSAALIELLQPDQFHVIPQDNAVVLVGALSTDRKHGQQLFVAQQKPRAHPELNAPQWHVMVAKQGTVEPSRYHQGDDLVLHQGMRYVGHPGALDFQKTQFNQYGIHLPEPPPPPSDDVRAFKSSYLWQIFNHNASAASELHWRLSLPLAVWVLFLLALPLSHLVPRQGRFAKILPAALIYVLYINLLFMGRHWIKSEVVSAQFGMWWIHALFVAVALFMMMYRHFGWQRFIWKRASL